MRIRLTWTFILRGASQNLVREPRGSGAQQVPGPCSKPLPSARRVPGLTSHFLRQISQLWCSSPGAVPCSHPIWPQVSHRDKSKPREGQGTLLSAVLPLVWWHAAQELRAASDGCFRPVCGHLWCFQTFWSNIDCWIGIPGTPRCVMQAVSLWQSISAGANIYSGRRVLFRVRTSNFKNL